MPGVTRQRRLRPRAAGTFQGARVTRDANQTIPNAVETALTFNVENFDVGGLANLGADNDRLTIQTAGKYLIGAQIVWAANAVGFRGLYLYQDANRVDTDEDAPPAGYSFRQRVITEMELAAGSVIKAQVYQDSGGDLDVASSGAGVPGSTPVLWAAKVG